MKIKKITTTGIITGTLLSVFITIPVVAEEAEDESTRIEQREDRREARLDRADRNDDGELSRAERQNARDHREDRIDQREDVADRREDIRVKIYGMLTIIHLRVQPHIDVINERM